MSITLGGITLPQDLFMPSLHKYTGIRVVKELSLTGVPYVWEGTLYERDLTLTGTADSGWIDRNTLVQLSNLSKQMYGRHSFNYENLVITTVRFVHESPPVIEYEPVIRKPNELSGDWFHSLVIKLEEYRP